MLGFIIAVITLAAQWRYFQKMGREGWEGIIPLYSTYVIFKELYGNGWKMLLLFIPIYNIYLFFKLNIDLAHAFNKGSGFGIGLVFFPFIFGLMLAFGSAVYRDGSYEKIGKDVFSAGLDDIADKLSGENPIYTKKEDIVKKLKDLNELHNAGIITDEEFKQKKEELLGRM